MSTRDDPRWRLLEQGREPVPFATERGVRTAAAIRFRAGRSHPTVQHMDDNGWHDCPGAECIPDRPATLADTLRADRIGLPRA